MVVKLLKKEKEIIVDLFFAVTENRLFESEISLRNPRKMFNVSTNGALYLEVVVLFHQH